MPAGVDLAQSEMIPDCKILKQEKGDLESQPEEEEQDDQDITGQKVLADEPLGALQWHREQQENLLPVKCCRYRSWEGSRHNPQPLKLLPMPS